MRLVHFSDTHIGFQAYTRLGPDGENVRQSDVSATFDRLIDAVIALAPDVVLVAGDVFHNPRPSTAAVLSAYSGFSRLRASLPNAIVCCAAGNHDLAKDRRGPSILQLVAKLGVHVADRSSMRFYFPARRLSVLVVPDAPGLGRPSFEPDARAETNLLCIHGDAHGVRQGGAYSRPSLTNITPDEIGYDRWQYTAYGHYHQREEIGPSAGYCGSPDFTSSNVWQEIAAPKGFIERDLETGTETFHVLEPSRRHVDLEPLYGQGLGAEELDRRIADTLESQSIDGAVVRLRVLGVTRDVERALNHKAVRSFARRALFLKLDVRRPAAVEAVSASGAPLGRRKFSPIEERLRAMLGSDAREIPNDVDRGALTALGVHYLNEAAAKEADSPAQETKLIDQLTESLQGAA